MKITLGLLLLSFALPLFTLAQSKADSVMSATDGHLGEKTMLVFFLVALALLILVGKFVYDLVIRKRH